MGNCSAKAKNIGVDFMFNILESKSVGSIEMAKYVTTLKSSLFNNEHDPLIMATVIEGSARIKPVKIGGLVKLTDIGEMNAYIQNNLNPDQTALTKLHTVKGFENFDEIVKTIEQVTAVNLVAPSSLRDVYSSETTSVESHGILIEPDEVAVDVLIMNNEGTEMLKRKSSRILKTKELKTTSDDFWVPFLSTYFPGMSSVGEDFANWTKDKFYDALIDKTEAKQGFIFNINESINKIKSEIEAGVLARKHTIPYTADTITASVLNGDREVKIKYFHEVLATDFDFILENLIRAITVSPAMTKATNEIVTGFVDAGNDTLPPITLKIPIGIKERFFTKEKGNKFAIKAALPGQAEIPKVMNKVPLDTLSFFNDTSLENNAFYLTEIDRKYFYRDSAGNNLAMTPKAYYSYNTASNRNQDSFDPFVGALDSDSSFIHNLFQMFKRVDRTEAGLIYGDRMSINDFLTIAPHLINAGKNQEKFIAEIKNLAQKEGSEAGRIARSLVTHVFSTEPTKMADGEKVHSIYQAAKHVGADRPTINNSIINALHAALINKDAIKYLKVEEGVTTVTKGVNSSTEGETVNIELAGLLMTDSYTKPAIAKHLNVSADGKVLSINVFNATIEYKDIQTVEDALRIARLLGKDVEGQLIAIQNKFTKVHSVPAQANQATVDMFKNIIYIAAVNKQKGALKPTENASKIFENANYITMAPTTVISGEPLKILASLYSADTNKATSVGGNLTASLSTPNRDSAIPEQLESYKYYNNNVNKVKFTFNPFIDGHSEVIPKATFGGVIIKTPTINNGKPVKLSDWDVKVRIEHAMIQGFLKAPKNIGNEFYLQPVNYSDKSNIEMLLASVDENMLADDSAMKEKLINAYIEYQVLKNEELQRIMIGGLSEYVVGNYETIYNKILSQADGETRLEALEKLKDMLLLDYSTKKGDMSKGINRLLAVVKLSPKDIEYSNATLDKGADYVTFDGNPGAALLKPHLGVRAAIYRDPKRARAEVHKALFDNKKRLKELRVNATGMIDSALDNTKAPIVTKTDDFYDRFYLINGIYGHSLKVLTMGDESYFPAKYKKGESIKDYYDAVDSGTRNGLEESEGMLKAQFKRAQSELTRGNAYGQKDTLEGYKRRQAKDNILQYLNIYGDNTLGRNTMGNRTMYNSTYKFDGLYGKTLTELEGMGILARFEDGNIISNNGHGELIRFNVGKDLVTVGLYDSAIANLKLEYDGPFIDALYTLATTVFENTKKSASEAKHTRLSNIPVDITNRPGAIKGVPGREKQMSLDDYLDKISEVKSNYSVLMPDLVPSITVNDPISNINILNSMGVNQDNSDGVQYMHPLLSLIMQEARGGILGAFNTDNQEPMKVLTTTFEYDKMRQVLQKKSIQMPFTYEQMKKLGNMELYNAFKNMNTAIQFKQFNMKAKKNNKDVIIQANNLHELYEKVVKDNIAGYNASDEAVWGEVLDILRRNPLNMYSFVGLLTFPSGQKTGHKKLNKIDSIFRKADGIADPNINIDYTATEFSYEVLTKAHDYDVSEALRDSSTLTLLSQLVNAIPFGGLSDIHTKNLQNSMAGKMMINRLKVGKNLAVVARKMQAGDVNAAKYDAIIKRFEEGSVSTKGLDSDQMNAYDSILRAGVYEMANLAFQKNDSILIEKIIKGLKITTDEDGNEIVIENAYSLDSPAVRNKVMGTLRAAFFKDTVKMKMSGFMAAVAPSNRTVSVFTLPNGKRVGRQGFIQEALISGIPVGGQGSVVQIRPDNIAEAKKYILPFDDVMIIRKRRDGSQLPSELKAFGNIADEELNSPSTIIKGVYTPDARYDRNITAESFETLDENTLVKMTTNGATKTYYKWFIRENYSADEIASAIAKGGLKEDITEKFSLRWYDYTKDDGTNIKDTDEYRNMYRNTMLDSELKDEELTEKFNELRALLIIQTQSKDEAGNSLWKVAKPEVVLPMYMATAFNLEKGDSIHRVIGTDGNDLVNAVNFFNKSSAVAADHILLAKGGYVDEVQRIYSKKLLAGNNTFQEEVLEYLIAFEGEKNNSSFPKISDKGTAAINEIIARARAKKARSMAESFISALDIGAAHVPGQGKQSAFGGTVVEFLDAQGNTALVPTEHMVTTGGDFDIDTLSIMTKSIDANGNIYKPAASLVDGDKGYNVKNLLANYEHDIKASEQRVRKLFYGLDDENRKFVKVREEQLAQQQKIAAGAPNDMVAQKKLLDLTEGLRRANNLIVPEEKLKDLIDRNRKKIHAMYENISSNVMIDAIFGSLNNVDTAVELNTPISMDMFKVLIDRIERFNNKQKLRRITATVDRSKGWFKELDSLPVFSQDGVNTMRTRKLSASHKHFGNPFTGSFVPGMIQVGPNVMTREEAKLPENRGLLLENIKVATDLYAEWLTSNKKIASYTNSKGQELELNFIHPEQREWIRRKISSGQLDGAKLLYMKDRGDYYSHADVLANIIKTRAGKQASGEDYTAIFESENLAAQGKEAIGIFATVLKINSAIQVAKINYDTNYAHVDRKSFDNPFFFESSISYTDFETGKVENHSRDNFADLGRFNISKSVAKSTNLQKLIAKLVNAPGSKYNKDSLKTLINVLKGEVEARLNVSEVDYDSEEAVKLIASLSKSLFNITVPGSVLVSKSPLDEFVKYLGLNPALVAKAYTNVIGKQLSDNVQSQFLSAATDNAKELILGKIKSNQITNPVITAMMLLGYDVKAIIDFLYDPEISSILDQLAEKVGDMERVSINETTLDGLGVDITTPAVKSLLEVLAVSDEVNKFRAIRSLNENAQIEHYKLDKILTSLNSTVLYEAILADDAGDTNAINNIAPQNEAQKTFNPDMFVFLHPQSRALFIQVYESERFKIKSLFKTVEEVSTIAGDSGRTINAYKNINSYLSDIQVEGFLNQFKVEKNSKGEKVTIFRTGDVVSSDENGNIKREILPLNQPANRAAFVRGFETYINKAREELRQLTGADNAALEQLGRGNTYKSNNPIIYIPKIKSSNADSLDISLIHEGINELKVKTGNDAVDKLNRNIYNNISLYALIVSSGEIKKGSMIELFEEISLELAEYVNTLGAKYYSSKRPTELAIPEIIKGDIKFIDELKEKKTYFKEYEEQDATPDIGEEDAGENTWENYDDEMPEVDENGEERPMYKTRETKIVKTPVVGNKKSVGKVFKLNDYQLRGDVFYAFKSGQLAYRLFPAENAEALPATTMQSSISFSKINKKFVSQLSLTGYQIGLSAKYKNDDVVNDLGEESAENNSRILAYYGLKDGFEQYIVAHPSGTLIVPGVHLMQENPLILLSKNIISPINSRNVKHAIRKKAYNATVYERVPKTHVFLDNNVGVVDTVAFTDEELMGDSIISRESRVLGIPGKAYDVIKLSNRGMTNSTKSFVQYNLRDDEFRTADDSSRSTLIPAITTSVGYGSIKSEDMLIVNELMAQVSGILNNIDVGQEVTFYGIEEKPNIRKSSTSVLLGGMDMLNTFISSQLVKRNNDTVSYLSNNFDVTKVYEESTNMYRMTFSRKKKTAGIVMANGETIRVNMVADPDTGMLSSKEWLNDQVKLKAIEQNLLTPPYKNVGVGTGGKAETLLVLQISKGNYEMFIRRYDSRFNDKYFKIKPSTTDKVGIFDTDNLVYIMPMDKYNELVDIVKTDKSTIINNKSC